MLHHGVDLIEIGRIRRAIERWGERFLSRIYTEEERRRYESRVQELAVRFAGKEAVMKALGTGRRGISWRDIEILSDDSGKPRVLLRGGARRRASELGLEDIEISLSHSREMAMASAIGISGGRDEAPQGG